MASTTLGIKDFTAKFRETTVEKMGSLVSDSWKRSHSGKIADLRQGCFYPHGYFYLLKAKGQTKRLEWLRDKGCFYHGIAPSKYFDHIDRPSSPTGKKLIAYRVKSGQLPSEALKALRTGLTFLGCGEACQLAQYETLNEFLGDDKFNTLFAADSATPLTMGYNSPFNPLGALSRSLERPVVIEKLQPGMVVYMFNTRLYVIKHLTGAAQGDNVMYMGEGKFLGLGHKPKGSIPEEIAEDLVQKYNLSNDADTTTVTKEVARTILAANIGRVLVAGREMSKLELREHLSSHTIRSFAELDKDPGGTFAARIGDLDYAKIHALYLSSTGRARELLNEWHSRRAARAVSRTR